jgi:hypothetical protein
MESRRIANYTLAKLAVTNSADRCRRLLSIVMGVQEVPLKRIGQGGR